MDGAADTMTIKDLQDIQACLQGDGEAYARLVRRHQDRIGRYLWRFTRDRAVCEELLQEVFVQAWLSLGSYRARSPFEHWLMRIATRVGYRYWKNRRRAVQFISAGEVELSQSTAAADDASPGEAAEMLHSLLERLPPRDRLVLTLMYLEERSVDQIASLVGWTRTMVKVQAHRARQKLRKLLEQQERS